MRLIFDFIFKNLIHVLLGVGVFLIFVHFSYLKLNTADGSLYLSTAENIAGHKGFVVSYNLCQSFNTLYHPVLAYYQPLYSLFSSIFIDHGGIVRIIQINILFLALNTVLIYSIIQELIPTDLNVLFTLFLVFSYNFFYSALYPWTEQIHFLCFISTFILFLKHKSSPRHLKWLGCLNGVFMLVRVAHLYNFLAYLPVLFIGRDPLRRKFGRALYFAGGFVLVYGLYQLFCLFFYHVFYPEYARPGASYGMARLTEGIIYAPDHAGIQVFCGSFFSSKNFLYIGQHLRDFFFKMPIFIWPAFLYCLIPVNKRTDGGLVGLCFSQSIFTILGYSFTFYWLPYHFEALRYSLIPYVLMSLAGWYCLYQLMSFIDSRWKKWAMGVVLAGLVGLQMYKYTEYNSNLKKHAVWDRPYYKDLLESYHWIDKNLPQEILVASNQDQEGYFMHRPFISTPPGRSFNCTNLSLYDHIYSPDYYLLSYEVKDKCFASIPHSVVFTNRSFRIYKVSK